jgi:hypothetical protein
MGVPGRKVSIEEGHSKQQNARVHVSCPEQATHYVLTRGLRALMLTVKFAKIYYKPQQLCHLSNKHRYYVVETIRKQYVISLS